MNLFYLYESETQTKLLEDCEPSSLGLRGPLGVRSGVLNKNENLINLLKFCNSLRSNNMLVWTNKY